MAQSALTGPRQQLISFTCKFFALCNFLSFIRQEFGRGSRRLEVRLVLTTIHYYNRNLSKETVHHPIYGRSKNENHWSGRQCRYRINVYSGQSLKIIGEEIKFQLDCEGRYWSYVTWSELKLNIIIKSVEVVPPRERMKHEHTNRIMMVSRCEDSSSPPITALLWQCRGVKNASLHQWEGGLALWGVRFVAPRRAVWDLTPLSLSNEDIILSHWSPSSATPWAFIWWLMWQTLPVCKDCTVLKYSSLVLRCKSGPTSLNRASSLAPVSHTVKRTLNTNFTLLYLRLDCMK